MNKVKKVVFDILDREGVNGIAEKIINLCLVLLIILNVVAMMIEPSISSQRFILFLKIFEIFSIVVFTVEYLLRLWVSDLYYPDKPKWKARIKYIFTGMAIIDLLAILPFYIPFIIKIDLRALRVLRIFRLFRLFKANRYSTSMRNVFLVIKDKSSELISSVIVVFTLMIMASAIMFNIENAAQPDKFRSIFDSMWWATATLTTVGYGDIYPITVLGKILAALIALLGIGIVAIPTGIIASGFMAQFHKKKIICPHCGKGIE